MTQTSISNLLHCPRARARSGIREIIFIHKHINMLLYSFHTQPKPLCLPNSHPIHPTNQNLTNNQICSHTNTTTPKMRYTVDALYTSPQDMTVEMTNLRNEAENIQYVRQALTSNEQSRNENAVSNFAFHRFISRILARKHKHNRDGIST